MFTAFIVAMRNTRGWDIVVGRLAGVERIVAEVVGERRFTCLPEPLIPAKGFSCVNNLSLWVAATRFSVSMTSWLWSAARFASSKIGAISNWLGATSLCLVFAGMPSL